MSIRKSGGSDEPAHAKRVQVTIELLDRGCICFMGNPPCSFCTEMSQEEAEAYATGGRKALLSFVYGMSKECYEFVQSKIELNANYTLRSRADETEPAQR